MKKNKFSIFWCPGTVFRHQTCSGTVQSNLGGNHDFEIFQKIWNTFACRNQAKQDKISFFCVPSKAMDFCASFDTLAIFVAQLEPFRSST